MANFDERWNLPVQPLADIVGNVPNVPTIQQPPIPSNYLLPVEPLQFQKPLIELPDNGIIKSDYNISAGNATLNKLFGLDEDRFKTWPERMAVSGATLPGDVYSGKEPITNDGRTSEKVIERTQDTAGMAGMSTLGIKPGTASVGSGATRTIYRGEYSGNKGGKFWSMDPEFARQFTQSGLEKEVKSKTIAEKDIYKSPETYAGNSEAVDLALAEAKKGGFKAVELNEGHGQPNSILFLEDTKAATAIGALNQSGMYSNLERTIANSKVQKATPEQWTSYLKNQPGIKPEELEFSLGGLGSGVVTKEQLANHVAENGIKLGEKWNKDVSMKDMENKIAQEKYGKDWDELNVDQIRRIGETENLYPYQPTKFSSYQLPGSSGNYRELLLTVPEKKGLKRQELDELQRKITEGEFNSLNDTQRHQMFMQRDALRTEAFKESGEPYKSSHWDEPNVLAHVRMNDREIPGVGKTLHIEEIQSDWHQAGRKQGYRGNMPIAKRQAEIETQLRSLIDKAPADLQHAEKAAWADKNFPEYSTLREELFANQKAEHAENKGVPNAPFKKSWDELALKRALTEAATKGYDALSWTPGEAQAARYDLSKHYEDIQIVKRQDGTYNIFGTQRGEKSSNAIQDHVPENKLADFVGKELAEKAVRGKEEFSGVDLKVGGEGMKAFYDTMLPAKASALVKKMGGKVEYENLPNSGGKSYGDILKAIGKTSDEWKALTAQERADILQKHGIGQKIPIIKITPEMKKNIAEKGFPLYSAGVPTFTPVDDPNKRKLTPISYDPFKMTPVNYQPEF